VTSSGRLAVGLFAILLAGCQTSQDRLSQISLHMAPPGSTSNADGFWRTIDGSDSGLSVPALRRHIALCMDTGATSQLVVYNGKIVSEWYSPRHTEPVGAMSSTKVVASILIGQLVDKGLLSYDQTVTSVLPEWTGGLRDRVTIRSLLTHSAGFLSRTTAANSIGYVADKSAFVITLSPDVAPGSKYSYSNEGAQLLEPVIRRISGEPTDQYAEKALFQPLGMEDTKLYAYGGSAWLYSEMQTTTRDMARIGLLMAAGGAWKNRQIVSPSYISEATRPSATYREMGLLWWLLDQPQTLPGFYASGYLNTDIYVFPSHHLVIVRTQSPRHGFTGAPESGDYFQKALPIFRQLVG
jgi:CubicO group peptidase (beta-lactamase class C family)